MAMPSKPKIRSSTREIREELLVLGKAHPIPPTGCAWGCYIGFHNYRHLARRIDNWGDVWKLYKCRDCGKLLIDKI